VAPKLITNGKVPRPGIGIIVLDELVNQENIDAKLNDGVLRLSLPKAETDC